MKAMWNNAVIAESNSTEIVDGNHYFPFDAIKSEYFSVDIESLAMSFPKIIAMTPIIEIPIMRIIE